MKKIHFTFSENQKLHVRELLLCTLSFCLTAAVLLFLFWQKGYSPFGNQSLASQDANIQYLDLFAYLKDVMSGENSISYTFSKTLGGTNIAVFAYYLSSPFNLLLLFFDKSNLVSFFDCVVVLKLAAAAFTMAFFLERRFQGRLRACFVPFLAMSYGLMQYSLAQSSNLMWLDGVYMLPLMLLGVYRLVNEKKSFLLVISTGLAILFSWYSAGINCLFTAVWFCLEWLLNLPGGSSKAGTDPADAPKKADAGRTSVLCGTLKTAFLYVISLLGGVGLSACLFLPTLLALSSSSRGQLDLYLLRNVFSANPLNIIQNFTVGSTSFSGNVSLYCGSFALLGCIGFFFSRRIGYAEKIKIGIVLLFSLLIYYWQPLFILFSLLKNAESFWYRYSYVTIFLIIFIAAKFYSQIQIQPSKGWKTAVFLLKIALGYSAVLLVYSYFHPLWAAKRIIYSCVFIIGTAALTGWCLKPRERLKWQPVAVFLLLGALTVELTYNANLLMNAYSVSNASEYHDYSVSEQEQIGELKEYDSGQYRISQTSTYNVSELTHLTANYNEAVAYNYWSISGYTSDPDGRQISLLERLGYMSSGANMCIVNTSILAADSLLGVKYVLTDLQINGLELLDSLGEYNGKSVYYNPYALPLAFTCSASEDPDLEEADGDALNPFAYQNLLYSQLLGEEISLYIPLEYEISEVSDSGQTYTLYLPEGNYAVYGNLPWLSFMDAVLYVNDTYETAYARWLSPSVFYIPTDNGDQTATVVIKYEENRITEEQFYALDLDALSYAAGKLSSGAADDSLIENGYAKFQVWAESGENLYLSIPYNVGWTITVNGEEVEPELFADCMMTIPLDEGFNTVEMKYRVPGLTAGTGISLAVLVLLVLAMTVERKKKGKPDRKHREIKINQEN
ncbi:MAG: YfhO family protein [Lachnospiraceae bacterium]|nr:YfhO family protein [Lachnospiraceae bacterium]